MSTGHELVYGAPCWLDLSTADIERAVAFYGELFGWEAHDTRADFGHYTNMTKSSVAEQSSPYLSARLMDLP